MIHTARSFGNFTSVTKYIKYEIQNIISYFSKGCQKSLFSMIRNQDTQRLSKGCPTVDVRLSGGLS